MSTSIKSNKNYQVPTISRNCILDLRAVQKHEPWPSTQMLCWDWLLGDRWIPNHIRANHIKYLIYFKWLCWYNLFPTVFWIDTWWNWKYLISHTVFFFSFVHNKWENKFIFILLRHYWFQNLLVPETFCCV